MSNCNDAILEPDDLGVDWNWCWFTLKANFDLRVGETIDLAILINGTRIQCRGTILAIEEFGNKVQARLRFTRTSNSEHRKLSDYLHTLYWGRFQKWVIGGFHPIGLYRLPLQPPLPLKILHPPPLFQPSICFFSTHWCLRIQIELETVPLCQIYRLAFEIKAGAGISEFVCFS